MFDTLDDQMKKDDQASKTSKERMLTWAAIVVVSLLVFGGLYFGVSMAE